MIKMGMVEQGTSEAWLVKYGQLALELAGLRIE